MLNKKNPVEAVEVLPLEVSKVDRIRTKEERYKKLFEKKVKFEFEKQNKNSVRYKELPEEGMPPVIGSIYLQKWFAGTSKNIEITINKKD